VWATKTESAKTRGDGTVAEGIVKLLLDGQQRITTLYGIIRGRPPRFFEGDPATFSNLYFHVEREDFRFFSPVAMRDNPLWFDVTALTKPDGVGQAAQRLMGQPDFQTSFSTYFSRLQAVATIPQTTFHVEEVTGEDKTVDVVVGIFNKVNSGGTKLSKGDLALAKVCAEWPGAREEMNGVLAKYRKAGFDFRLEWLLRCVNAVVTGEALFDFLADIGPSEFREGLTDAEKAVDTLLNLIAARLGLDHDRVLGSRYSLPLLARYITARGGSLPDTREQGSILYWYVHTMLWGRYAGSTESVLNQDLRLIENADGALDRLIGQLRSQRGDLRVQPIDFGGWSRGARFYPLLYMLTRTGHARDWGTGIELQNHLLGSLARLEVHHVFPQARLYKHGYTRPEVNALANLTFLTQETNLKVSDRDPAEYLEEIAAKQPGALESHWIPMDRELWKVERFRDFLEVRRGLLADAANLLLDGLLGSMSVEVGPMPAVLDRPAVEVGGVAGEDEERLINELNDWIAAKGLPRGEVMYEILHTDSKEPVALLDLAWPDGLQAGLSHPVALLVDEGTETESAANEAGFRFFTDPQEFRDYVEREILAQQDAKLDAV